MAEGAFDKLPRDYRDFLAELGRAGCEYLVVGGWAMAAHGHPRATKDLDVFVRAAPENAPRVVRALGLFGAPLAAVTVDDFAVPGVILQIGTALRIDVTTTIEGVGFDEAARDKLLVKLDGADVPVIGREALVKNKRAAGRHQDLADVKKLEQGTRRGR